MVDIIMYTKDYCPYCTKAKQLFKQKGVDEFVREVDITKDENLQQEMISKSGGRRTVPQIFINGTHVGGCDDLYAMNAAGTLEPLLKAS